MTKYALALALIFCITVSGVQAAKKKTCNGSPLVFKFRAVGDLAELNEEEISKAIYNVTGVEVLLRSMSFTTRTVYAMYNFTEEKEDGLYQSMEDAFGVVLDEAVGASVGVVNALDLKQPEAETVSIKTAANTTKQDSDPVVLLDLEVLSSNGTSFDDAADLTAELLDLDWIAFQATSKDVMRSAAAADVPNSLAKYMESATVVAVLPPQEHARVEVLIPHDCEMPPSVVKTQLRELISNGTLAAAVEANTGLELQLLLTKQYLTDAVEEVPAAPVLPPKEEEKEQGSRDGAVPAAAPAESAITPEEVLPELTTEREVVPGGEGRDDVMPVAREFNADAEVPVLAPYIDEEKLAQAAKEQEQNAAVPASAASSTLLLLVVGAAALLAL